MKRLLFVLVALVFVFVTTAEARSVKVNGYITKKGTYVAPYVRSSPNKMPTDNYDFKGNVNPFTGKTGTNEYKSNPKSPYFDGSVPGGEK